MNYLPIIHHSTEVAQFPVYGTLSLTSELMGAKEIQADIELPYAIKPPIGAFITVKGKKYTLNTPPLNVTKQSNTLYKYSLMFEGALYRLYDKGLKHLGNKTFQYYGKPIDFAQLIVDNINTIDSGWTVGLCDDLPAININFDKHTCRTAMDTVAEAFKIEWNNNEKEISFVKQVGNVTTLVFEYGRGKGLYSLSYAYQSDKNVVTRAFGYGSTRNLPEGYRGGATQLMFDGQYLEKNVFMPDGVTPLYGVKEGDYDNEDIYPEIVGTVSAVSVYDPDAGTFTITDNSLYFDLNIYFSADTPKVSFLTGEFQGQEFEITRYVHATKTITLKVFVDGNNNTLPNSVFQAHVGDTFNLFDMHLPTEVVTAAEERLRVATQTWLNENCIPRVLYSLELDPLYARDNGVMLNIGDKVRIIDTGLGIDDMIRVTKTVYPINFPEVITPETKISAEIANFIPYTTTERVIAATIDNQKDIKVVDRTNAERARQNALSLNQLSGRIFDPDGNLAKGAETLFAGMAKIGFDSQNFGLLDVTIAANVGANANALAISVGLLTHFLYEIEGLGYQWVMTANTWTGLDPAKFYYAYAKCSKTALVGTWEISETPVFVNDFPGYWVFNLGQLSQVNSKGYRIFDPTKGVTYIVGDMIRTGIIQDLSGQNYINLTNGTFNFGTPQFGIDFGITVPGRATNRGGFFQSGSGIIAPLPVYRGTYNSAVTYWPGETVSYAGGSWVYINDVPDAGHTPADDAYWDVFATKGGAGDPGANGNYTEFIFQKNGSTTVAPALTQTDTNPSGWSVVQPSTSTGEYLWMSSALKSGTTGVLINPWATPVRTNSKDGDPGTAGSPGPSLSYTGNYDPARTYTGTELRIEVVKYSGVYYFTRADAGTFSGVLPTDTSKWNPAGGQFDSIATGLLLAEAATIDNLTVRNVKTAEAGTKHAEINGSENNIKIIDAPGNELIVLDDDSAIEYITLDTGGSTPILVNHYGPGIKVGITGGRTGSYGRRAIMLTDASGVEQFFIGTDSSSSARVALDIYNGLHLKNADGGIKQTIAGVDHTGVNATVRFPDQGIGGTAVVFHINNGLITEITGSYYT